jgi:GT2 family glycosyltransferase
VFWIEDTAERVELRLDAPRATTVRAALGAADAVPASVGPDGRTVVLDGRSVSAGPAIALVNNVGTGWRADGYGYDLGYLEPDDGRFDAAVEVDAWCGGAVLLRAEHLRAIGRFDEDLFLYYEDLDLALRGRRAGGRFALVPASVVDHEHAATAVSGSSFAEYHKERNRLLVVLRHRGWAAAVRAALAFVVATLGYVRRDVLGNAVHGRRPSGAIVGYRVRALGGAIRRAPRFRPGSRPRISA